MDEIKEIADKVNQGLIYLYNWLEHDLYNWLEHEQTTDCEYIAETPGDLILEILDDVNRISELAEEFDDE